MADLQSVDDENFESKVFQAGKPVLVDFSAEWCGPCKAMAPAVADLAREYAGEADVLVLDVDKSPKTVERFHIRGVPSFLLFRGEEILTHITGGTSRSSLAQAIDSALEQ